MSATENQRAASIPDEGGRPWGSIRKRSGGYFVRFVAGGHEYERGNEGRPIASKATAQALRRRARALLEGGTPVEDVLASVFGDRAGGAISLRDLAAPYAASAGTWKKPSVMERDARRLSFLLAQPWASQPLGTLRAEAIRRWVDQRMRDGAAPSTVNRDVALARVVVEWGRKMGHVVAGNPFAGVEKMSERGRERRIYLTVEEARGLVESCRPPLHAVVRFALATGARAGEILSLRWSCVDFGRRTAYITPENEKAKRGRTIPLSPTVLAMLADLKASRSSLRLDGDEPVFSRSDGNAWTYDELRYAFDLAVSRCAALPVEKREALSFHGLRHACASLLIQNGASLGDVAALLGQSSAWVTARYAHLCPRQAERAAATVAALLDGPAQGVENARRVGGI